MTGSVDDLGVAVDDIGRHSSLVLVKVQKEV